MASSAARTPKVAFDEASVIVFKDCQAGVKQLASGDDDNVVPGGNFVPAKYLSNQPFSTISHDRIAKPAGRRNPQPARSTPTI
jgi:hypothetical protein